MLYEVGRTGLDLLGLMRPLTFFTDIFFCTIRICIFFKLLRIVRRRIICEGVALFLCVNPVKGAVGCEAVFRQA